MPHRLIARFVPAVLVLAGLAVANPAAAASTDPPWEPDANSFGSLSFYDAGGQKITGGNDLSHLFDYAVADTASSRSTNKATAYFGFPDHTKPDTITWFAKERSASTNYPNSSAPAPVNGFNRPTVTAGPSGANLQELLSTTTLDQTAGYKNLVQIRIRDSGPGKPLSDSFWSADISFDPTANTWTQVYPQAAGGTPTTTTATSLGVTPDSPAASGTLETLTATVTPTDAPGAVTFNDNGSAIGGPVTVGAGVAKTNTTLSAGSHSLTATFTPSDPSFAASTSSAVTYSVTAPATPTTTSLGATPASPRAEKTPITFTATVAPSTVTGKVQFKDNGTNLDVAQPLTNGVASVTTTSLGFGSHQITAEFTPADATKAQASTSTASTYVIATFPGAPASVSATPLNTTATVSWTPPANDGGTPVLGYDVQYSTDGVSWVTTAPQTRTSTATSAQATGLVNGTPYFFRVRTINGIGNSEYQQTASTVTPHADATSIAIAAPPAVRYGTAARISALVLNARDHSRVAGAVLLLLRRPNARAPWSVAARVGTNAAGAATVAIGLGANTLFEWRFDGTARQTAALSAARLVTVPQVLTLARTPAKIKHGKSIKLYGYATPAGAGQRVTVQQLVGRGWKTIGTVLVKRQKLPNGRTAVGYALSRKLGKKGNYAFRAFKAATATNTAAVSGVVSVRAT